MDRREFVGGLGAATVMWPRGAHAQARQPVIGFFGPHSSTTLAAALLPAFHQGLAEQGYIEGRNVSVGLPVVRRVIRTSALVGHRACAPQSRRDRCGR